MNGIIHILRGKRSAQTIQDISLFKLERWTAILKNESKTFVDQGVHDLKKYHLIEEHDKKEVTLSPAGKQSLDSLSDSFEMPRSFNGLKYEWNESRAYFWEHLSLLVQSISFIKERQYTFIPISYNRDVQKKVKQLLKNKNNNLQQLGSQLYTELGTILGFLPEKEAELFVSRLTSFFRVGRTFDQLSVSYSDDPLFTAIAFRSIIHEMMNRVAETPRSYPLLYSLISENEELATVTKTSAVTKKLLASGHTIQQIAVKRQLKLSTIEDHIIELSIHDSNFNFTDFITTEQMKEIREYADRLSTKKLRPIKGELGDKYTYFQIRLAISSQKGEKNS
ncbi:helix-turn-helix domain-containing protein [Salipaludibacillus sp. HK11]|uniref:helix-turn-helix domain-containing protein n=1 Tax=Salipaludibacillus sp. HK11 TaxID=3394320 RepID=UPI0039FCC0D7